MSINNEKIIHVVSEMIVVAGLVFYFKKINSQLLYQVNEKFKNLDEHIKKQEYTIECLKNKLDMLDARTLSFNKPVPVSATHSEQYTKNDKCTKSFSGDKINATYTSLPSKQPKNHFQQKQGNHLSTKGSDEPKKMHLFNLNNLQNIGLGGVVMMGGGGGGKIKKKVEFNIEEINDDEEAGEEEEVRTDGHREEDRGQKEVGRDEEEEEDDEEEIEKELASELKDLLG